MRCGRVLSDTCSRTPRPASLGERSRPPPTARCSLPPRRRPGSCARCAPPRAPTERETEVLKLLALGKANKQISRDLFVGEKTVKSHVSSILTKLGVQSRTQAALYAVRIGLVSIDELNEESW